MHYLFVTGKLAADALRAQLAELAPKAGFSYEVAVLNITVAALMTPAWIARHLHVPEECDRIMVPGACTGDWTLLETTSQVPVEKGPADLRDLPEHFGQQKLTDYGDYDIEILAEINHAPRLAVKELLRQAEQFRASGADVIDLGCDPGHTWQEIGTAVTELRARGLRVSVDSFNPVEVSAAVQAGAELVLSVNHSNLDAAQDWGCEIVAVPDQPGTLDGYHNLIEGLQKRGIKFRLDPILEPIGFGFAASLGRYLEVRRRYPDTEMMLGIGNLTELTEVDSAGVNLVLLGFCQELGIRSVLTTEVINWARSSVRELEIARRLVHYAYKHRVLPKRLDSRLVRLRDPKLRPQGKEALAALAAHVTDRNFRLFAEEGQLHVINGKMHLQGIDPFALFQQMMAKEEIDPSHAFYLGYEMAKAVTALTLHKNYVQDQGLKWGHLTVPERSGRDRIPSEEPPEPPPEQNT
jgi:dihydropteroate synthase-like protein